MLSDASDEMGSSRRLSSSRASRSPVSLLLRVLRQVSALSYAEQASKVTVYLSSMEGGGTSGSLPDHLQCCGHRYPPRPLNLAVLR